MQFRQMGRNGPEISAIGIGAMSFSDFYGPTDAAQSHAILDWAIERGVTHIDTANVYGMGKSESAIGSFLAGRGAAVRDRFVIATKASIRRHADGSGSFIDNSPGHLESELDASLERMGIEAVDLFYAHRRAPGVAVEEVAGALGRLVEKGKTKAIGFSEIAPSTLRRAHGEHPVAAVQSEYSLSTRSPELGLVQTCAEMGISLVAFSPVGRSLLTDDPVSLDVAQSIGFMKANERFMEPNYSANIAATDRFRALAAEMGIPAAGLAIAWVLAQGDQVVAIPGTRSVAHFDELLDGAVDLSATDLARIEAVLPVGWCHGDRYNAAQWQFPERYC